MAFTNVFDNGFPLDTQQAKLLGDDIRKFKVDIQERIASMSGLDAAKPDLGSDTQPTKWNGTLFFATDTGKIYQFTNPNWVFVGGAFLTSAKRYSVFGGTTSADGETLATITIPTGIVAVGSFILISTVGSMSGCLLQVVISGNSGTPLQYSSADSSFPLFITASVLTATTVAIADAALVPTGGVAAWGLVNNAIITVPDILSNDLTFVFKQLTAGSMLNRHISAIVYP